MMPRFLRFVRPAVQKAFNVLRQTTVLLVGFFVAFLIAYATLSASRSNAREPGPATTAAVAIPPAVETRLWFVYVGSPDCEWSTQTATQDAVRTLWTRLREHAEQTDLVFTALGVAPTPDFTDGLTYLNRLGSFDEVSIGPYLANTITLDYFLSEGIVPSTPQILVFERVLRRTDRGALPGELSATTLNRLARASGLSAITTWARSGHLLPPSGQTVYPGYSTTQEGEFR